MQGCQFSSFKVSSRSQHPCRSGRAGPKSGRHPAGNRVCMMAVQRLVAQLGDSNQILRLTGLSGRKTLEPTFSCAFELLFLSVCQQPHILVLRRRPAAHWSCFVLLLDRLVEEHRNLNLDSAISGLDKP